MKHKYNFSVKNGHACGATVDYDGFACCTDRWYRVTCKKCLRMRPKKSKKPKK